MSRVVVVGAGSAGLACARRLAAAGLDVLVVEARARVGGRTWSEPLANGHIAERGGEYFDRSMVEVHELAAELGLTMTTQGFNASVRGTVDPRDPDLATLETGAKTISDYWASLGSIHESVSIQQVVDGAGLEPRVAAIISARLSSGRAAQVSRVSARWSEDGSLGVLVAHEHNTRIAEGNQRLSEGMASELAPEQVRRRWPVGSISREGSGYRVVSMRGDAVEADAVVVAVPAPVAATLQIEGLDPRTREALDKLGFGQATKLHLVVEGECPPNVRQEVMNPFSTWATQGIGMQDAAFVTGFGATHETQTKLAVAHGPSIFRPQLEAQWPGVRFGSDALLTYWGGDPWTRGAYSYRPLGWTSQDQEFLARPSERIFFAGEHTADKFTSSICGAIRSGYRAAKEVVSTLSG